MFNKLKKRFTVLATVSMLLLMTTLVVVMNVINYSTVISESDEVLSVLVQPELDLFINGGDAAPPESADMPEPALDELPDLLPEKQLSDLLPHNMSPEVPYESRYFTVMADAEGNITETDTAQVVSVTAEEAEEYAQKVLYGRKKSGFIGSYRFLRSNDGVVTRIVFLDCGRRLAAFRRFLLISTLTGIGGCALCFVLFLFASGRIVRPIAESYAKQKRFITDAGHEIKTPLTVINAYLDLLEDDVGENESIDDIRTQTKRLTKLTRDLVYLSKMEENGSSIPKVEFPLSDVAEETAAHFKPVAEAHGITYTVGIEPGMNMNGIPDSISQLISILLDNAMKYTPEGGAVSLSLTEQKKQTVLSVTNTCEQEFTSAELSQLFERFYRTDASRSSETGGHGIGLSIAQAITEAHHGKISAEAPGEGQFRITAVF